LTAAFWLRARRLRIIRAMKMRVSIVALALLLTSLIASGVAAEWNPERFAGQETLQFLTVSADGDEHWSTVWLVVLDGQVYVRLGTRAADRFNSSTRAPLVDVRIGEETFHNVRFDPAPDMADTVATAMADKYWFDVIAKRMAHPLTARLVAQDSGRI
jgi:hypothetical protein